MSFALPLGRKKVDIPFSSIMPRLLQLLNSPNEKAKVYASELVHALVVFMIGRKGSKSFVYKHIFPTLIKIATNK